MEPGIVIDGAVPRSNYERCVTLIDYMRTLPGTETEADKMGASLLRAKEEFYSEIEDEILALINGFLPDDFVCTLGEMEPGDVIVREVQMDELFGRM